MYRAKVAMSKIVRRQREGRDEGRGHAFTCSGNFLPLLRAATCSDQIQAEVTGPVATRSRPTKSDDKSAHSEEAVLGFSLSKSGLPGWRE